MRRRPTQRSGSERSARVRGALPPTGPPLTQTPASVQRPPPAPPRTDRLRLAPGAAVKLTGHRRPLPSPTRHARQPAPAPVTPPRLPQPTPPHRHTVVPCCPALGAGRQPRGATSRHRCHSTTLRRPVPTFAIVREHETRTTNHWPRARPPQPSANAYA